MVRIADKFRGGLIKLRVSDQDKPTTWHLQTFDDVVLIRCHVLNCYRKLIIPHLAHWAPHV